MLVTILKKEMKNCDIVLAYDDGYRIPAILQELLRLPNPRKLIYVRPSEELPGQAWESSQCRGYVYLLQDLAPLLHLADTRQDAWDFSGKFVVVAPTKAHLEELALSNCGRKTENIAGIAKASGKSEWGVYMNLLYWGAGVARINTWKRGRFTLPLALFPDKLSNLRGVVLEVVTFEWEPSVFYYRNKDGRVLFRYGTDIGVVNALSQVLNFTVAFKEPPKGEYWGREEENGSWSGMMGKLSRNEVDIGVGDLYMTIVRVGILDYTAPYDSELSCFMARTEPPLPRWQALAFPFQGFTWLAIFGGLVLTGPVLYLLARASNCCGEEIACLQSLAYSWYYAVGLHCCEAQVVLPAMKSTRAYVIFLWLYCMIITIAYSTNLTAFLLVTKQPQSMETIRDLHASGIEVSGVGKFYGDALASASDPYLQSLTHRFQDYSLAEPIFRKVLTGDSVMLQNRPYLEFVAATKFTNRGVSRMRLMKECFAPFNIAMAVQRNSPLKRKFDQVIGWMVSAGLIRHFFLDSLRLASSKVKPGAEGTNEDDPLYEVTGGLATTATGVIPLSLDHVQGIFFILFFGWLLSMLVFFTEVFVGERSKVKKSPVKVLE
ncbi:glutamate receptor ionotropic, delta-2-like [Penaeus vannamei]|uniref:glutamate receptor ionotropic, delta-2-like n=1 Tax=Penaeus vannamei TaxID=6689 RepID=UPI00387F8E32